MRKIREVLRLRHEQGLSHREIARVLLHRCWVRFRCYLQKTAERGLGWPLPTELDDAVLEGQLFSPRRPGARPGSGLTARTSTASSSGTGSRCSSSGRSTPWSIRRAIGRTQFCALYQQWARRLRPSMRQVHRAGEKTFLDFSGKRPTLIDGRTGASRRVELFVAVLGASRFTYVEATATQQLPDWVGAHTRMVEYFGGTTTLWVPDQLKSAITRPCRYEPGVNRTYEDLAAHYGAVVIPARRPRKPRDKSIVSQYVPPGLSRGVGRRDGFLCAA